MELINDHFQNFKRYNIPKAQLIIADIPYNIGVNAYASNPQWYNDGDNSKGESKLAKSQFFDTDNDFRISEFMHFAHRMLLKEPKEKGKAGCMIVFCEFEQQFMLIEEAKKHGFNNYINLVFRSKELPINLFPPKLIPLVDVEVLLFPPPLTLLKSCVAIFLESNSLPWTDKVVYPCNVWSRFTSSNITWIDNSLFIGNSSIFINSYKS